jgi:hypothetical protein
MSCSMVQVHEASEYSLPSGLGHDAYRSISYVCVFGNVKSRSKEGDDQRATTTHQGNILVYRDWNSKVKTRGLIFACHTWQYRCFSVVTLLKSLH